jgi:hypothetical protein
MPYQLRFASRAADTYRHLQGGGAATLVKFKKVRKALALLEQNPRHPGLHSHQYENFPGYPDEKVWDSYVENHTPSAWRIYWMYGPNERDEIKGTEIAVITVLQISDHP